MRGSVGSSKHLISQRFLRLRLEIEKNEGVGFFLKSELKEVEGLGGSYPPSLSWANKFRDLAGMQHLGGRDKHANNVQDVN